jgi:hypothetical protein
MSSAVMAMTNISSATRKRGTATPSYAGPSCELAQADRSYKSAYTLRSGRNRDKNHLVSAPQPRKNATYNDLIPVSCSIATHAPRTGERATLLGGTGTLWRAQWGSTSSYPGRPDRTRGERHTPHNAVLAGNVVIAVDGDVWIVHPDGRIVGRHGAPSPKVTVFRLADGPHSRPSADYLTRRFRHVPKFVKTVRAEPSIRTRPRNLRVPGNCAAATRGSPPCSRGRRFSRSSWSPAS